MNYFLARLKEPSTWRGGVLLASGLGVGLAPEQMDAIVSVGVSIAGAIGVFSPDKAAK